jgi:hypothetical protein
MLIDAQTANCFSNPNQSTADDRTVAPRHVKAAAPPKADRTPNYDAGYFDGH